MKRLCQVIGVARSSYYHWKATACDRAARVADDARLAARIRTIHRESAGTYGVPRITAELHDTGHRVNHKRVARIMRQVGLAGLRLRRRHRTTLADPTTVKAPDLLGRDFTAQAPNTRYVGDITYLPIADGTFLYLATVMDLCSRRLVGWAVADHMRTELVLHALHATQRTRGSVAGAVFHTDHGAQGEFNWSSQHFDDGGVGWDGRGSRCRGHRAGLDVSGLRIGRCGRRCAHPGGRSRLGRFSGTSGA